MPKSADCLGLCSSTGLPSKRIVPASYGWIPAKPLIRVDLPAPLSPTRAVTSPARTEKFTSFNTSTGPKLFLTLFNSITGVSLDKKIPFFVKNARITYLVLTPYYRCQDQI